MSPYWDDIVNKPEIFPTDWENVADKPETYPTTWNEVSDKPETYPTTWEEVDDKPSTYPSTWEEIDGKPDTYPADLSNYYTKNDIEEKLSETFDEKIKEIKQYIDDNYVRKDEMEAVGAADIISMIEEIRNNG